MHSSFSDIKNILENVGSNITAFTKKLPIQEILTDFTVYLTQSEAYVEDYFPLVEQYDFYRYVHIILMKKCRGYSISIIEDQYQ